MATCSSSAGVANKESTAQQDDNSEQGVSEPCGSSSVNVKLQNGSDARSLISCPCTSEDDKGDGLSEGTESEATKTVHDKGLKDVSLCDGIISSLSQAVAWIEAYVSAVDVDGCSEKCELKLSSLIFNIHSLMAKARYSKHLAEAIVEFPKILETLCIFVKFTFAKLNEGVSQRIVASLLSVEHWFWSLCDESKVFCGALSKMGMVSHFLYQLGELRKNSVHIEAVRELMFNSVGVIYTFITQREYHKQFVDIDYYKMLAPYVLSPVSRLRFVSLVTFSYTSGFIPEKERCLLQIERHEVEKILHSLVASVDTDSVHLFQLVFSVTEILSILQNLTVLQENSITFIGCGIAKVMLHLLQSDCKDIKLSALLLLWKLSCFLNSDIVESLRPLDSSSFEENEIKMAIIGEQTKTVTDIEKTMEVCYKYREFDKCSQLYEMYESKPTKKAMLLQAKALFHQYRREMSSLGEFAKDIKEYRIRHKSCFAKARKVILLLGTALDDGEIDEEASKFLDVSMIDYVSETNDLKSCSRCLLCRKKSSLRRSHLWPESLLRHYESGVDTPADHKLFYKVAEDGSLTRYSPHQFSYWMFCSNCEERFSRHGETQSIPLITSCIYSKSDPESTTKHMEICYKEEFYYFCVGLVFRGLASPDPHVSLSAFVNEDEIYELFLLCRKAMLQLEEVSLKFQLAAIFTPPYLPPDEQHSGFINSLLSHFGLFALSDAFLVDGRICIPREAQFFLAHCGVFNILVPLGQSRWVSLQPESLVHPRGGVLTIPDFRNRMKLLPPGVCTYLYLLADCAETNFFQIPSKVQETTWIDPQPEKEKVIGANFALDEDVVRNKGKIKSSWAPTNPKIINYLPKEFLVTRPSHRPSTVSLPPSHEILLHHSYTEKGTKYTLFLATGSNELYSDRVYLIYHCFQDGIQINGGFFVSVENLTALDLLPDNLEKYFAKKIHFFNKAKEGELRETLENMLRKKGFVNIHSLLMHYKRGGVLDMKCQPKKCWYCQDLCQYCMSPCTVGCEIFHSDVRYTFCFKCWKEHHLKGETRESEQPVVTAVPCSSSVKKENGHQVLLSIKQSTSWNSFTVFVCIGFPSGSYSRPYVLTQKRSLTEQECAEAFLSRDFSPIQPLPFSETSEEAKCKVLQLKEDGIVQALLKEVFSSEHGEHVASLFEFS